MMFANPKVLSMNDPNKKLTITTLMSAVKNNRIEQIRNSLNVYGLPKNGTKNTDYTILQTAIEKKKIEIAKLLINAGCRVKGNKNDSGCTPLGLAVQAENEELVDLLFQKGASLDAGQGGSTVLHLAAERSSLKMLLHLLRYQININQTCNGKTPFQVFLERSYNIQEKKNIDIIRMFLQRGASINFKGNDGMTALHYIVRTKQNDIIEKIVLATSNINEQNSSKNTALHILLSERAPEESILNIVKFFISKGAKVNMQNNSGDTAIHLAAKNKYLLIMQLFLRCEFDVNCCNEEGNTILHCIISSSTDYSNNEKYVQIVAQIMKHNSLKLVKNKRGETPLYLAAQNKQSQVMNHLLSMPVDVNATDSNGSTVLYIFMKYLVEKDIVPVKDDIESVKKMISKGANPIICHNETKFSPMHFALQLRSKELILLMLDCNFDFDTFNVAQGKSILHYLCNGKVDITDTEDLQMAEVAEICIRKGAAVDAKDENLRTPLYWAVLLRQKHMVQTLLKHGADANWCDCMGRFPLENLMETRAEVEMISFESYGWRPQLYRKRISKDIPKNIERDSEIAEMLFFKGAIAENTSDKQDSIFHYCASNLHLDMLLKIIPYCKDANKCNSLKNTILHTMLTYNLNVKEHVDERVTKILAILLSKGAEVNALNEKNETPLLLAAKGKLLEDSKILLQHNATATAFDKYGNSALHLLADSILQFENNDPTENGLTKLFIDKGCNVNAKNIDGMTPLLCAAKSGSVNVFKILMRHGAAMNCTEDKSLAMPIHLAAKHNHPEIIEQLLRCGVDVNVRQGDRKTALHLSVTHKLSNVTRLLLENGADTDMKDQNGKTPLHYACWHESLDNINELLDYGADVSAEDNYKATPLMLTRFSGETWTKLHFHVIKLQTANMRVSEKNKNFIKKVGVDRDNYTDKQAIREFESVAVEETLKMETVPIAVRTSLADVLQMSANKLSVFKCNEDFQKLLYAADFKEKYPIYADLVRACYRKGIIRSDLMLSAKNAFRKMLGLALPDTCCDVIFHYLDNENLHNLDKAAKVKITKRKRFLEEIEQSVPTKRTRRLSV